VLEYAAVAMMCRAGLRGACVARRAGGGAGWVRTGRFGWDHGASCEVRALDANRKNAF
jgi:hypothetical protein